MVKNDDFLDRQGFIVLFCKNVKYFDFDSKFEKFGIVWILLDNLDFIGKIQFC